jgi:formate hydrogenlyase subunit 3/multisubunit Na+/H+ antiporter MnhD subunit
VKDPSWLMKGPLVILCVLMIVFGVVATPLMDVFTAIASNLM